MNDLQAQQEPSNKSASKEASRRASKTKFPTGMFATAALCSAVMVFTISAVFAQSNAPCINSFSLKDKVIIDTTHSNVQNTSSEQPLTICNRNNQQIGWLTWLFKRNDSVDFHYLDLLELLSRK